MVACHLQCSSQTLLKKADHVSTFRTVCNRDSSSFPPYLSQISIADFEFVVVIIASQEIELTYARHDVFLSPFVETNKEALGYLCAFLIKASNLRIKF